jgi:FG-GAP-like repeat
MHDNIRKLSLILCTALIVFALGCQRRTSNAPQEQEEAASSAPMITAMSPASGIVNQAPARIVVVFNTPVKALAADVFSLGGNCTVLPTKGSVEMSGDGTSATLELVAGTCMSGHTLTVSVAPTAVVSTEGIAGVGPILTHTFSIETLGPAASLGAPSTTIMNAAASSTIALAFTPSASGGTTLADALTTDGGGVTVSALSGDPSCAVEVSTVTPFGAQITLSACQGNGTLSLHVDAGAVRDALGNPSTVSDESRVITIDNTPPTLALLSPTSASLRQPPTRVVAVFSEPLSGLSSAAFTLGGTCTSLPTKGALTMGQGEVTATLALSPGTCTEEQTTSVAIDPTSVLDRAGNRGVGPLVSSTYTVRSAGPLVSLGLPSSNLINASSAATFEVRFTPSLSGNTTLTGALTAAGDGVSVTSVSGDATCTVDVTAITHFGALITLSACTGSGALTIQIDEGVAQDGSGNLSPASAESAIVSVDNTRPMLASLSPTSGFVRPTPTHIVAVFSKSVEALSAEAFTVTGTCSALPDKGSVVMSAGNTTATLGLLGGACENGQTLSVEIDPTSVRDGLGNLGAGEVTKNTFTLLTSGPVASLGAPSLTLMSSSGSSTLALSFTPSLVGGTTLTGALTTGGGGVTLIGTPTCNVSVSEISASGAMVTLSACQGTGTVTVSVDAGAVVDALGNPSNASPESTAISAPTLTGVSPSDAFVLTPPTQIVAHFSEAVSTLTASDFILGGTCTTLPTRDSVQMSNANTTATLALSGGACGNAQALTVSLDPTHVTDPSGNAGNGSVLTRTYTVDTVGPTVSLAPPSPATVDASQTATIAVTFTPSAAGGNTLTGALSAAGAGVTLGIVRGNPSCALAVNSITPSGATITLSACTGNGSVRLQVDAGALTDTLGNSSSASNIQIVGVGNACTIPVGGYDYGDTTATTAVSADVNDDGSPDLIVGTPTTVGVLFGCAQHTFQTVTSYSVAGGSGRVAVGDLDADTHPDIVALGTSGGVTSVTVLKNDGSGGFVSQTAYPSLDDTALAAQLGDFNGDGHLDIVTLTRSAAQTTVSVRLNDGTGSFSAVHNSGLRATSSALTPDVYGCQSLVVLPGADQGALNDHLALACAPYTTDDVSGVTIDGRLIAIAVNSDGTLSQTAVRTFAAASFPTFGSSVAYASGSVKTLHVGSASSSGITTHPIDASWLFGTQSSVASSPISAQVLAKPNVVLWAGAGTTPGTQQLRAVKRTLSGVVDPTSFSLVSLLAGFQTLTFESTLTAILYVADEKVHGCSLAFNALTGRPLVSCSLY